VATHWHDDHIRGISAVFSECESAQLVISGALDAQDFRKLVALYSGQVTRERVPV
jgi:glyoxylase-like metal-dependent hydrolase (beta-lactamase superfamily II)